MTDIGDLLFTHNHEWIRVKDGKTATIGVSDFVNTLLSEVTHIDLPEPDEQEYEEGEELGVVESLKGSLPFHCPISGAITAANNSLLSAPEKINDDPYGEGWIFEMTLSDPSELAHLLTPDEYEDDLPDDEED
jgi:glycine cleavage system H protein